MNKSILENEKVLCRIKCRHFVEKSLQYHMRPVFLRKLKVFPTQIFLFWIDAVQLIKWQVKTVNIKGNLYNNKCSLTKTKDYHGREWITDV